MGHWQLARAGDNVAVVNTADGVLMQITPPSPLNWRDAPLVVINPINRLGRLLPTLIPQLADLGLAQWSPEGFVIPHDEFAELEVHDVDAFTDLIEWAPFSIVLESTGWLGGETHGYRYQFCLGARPVQVERLGSIVKRGEAFYRLDAPTFRLLQAIDAFNMLDVKKKASAEAFSRFAEIKGLAGNIGAQLDQYLLTERVLVPARVGLDLVIEPGDRISFAPRIEGVPEAAMRAAFFAEDDIEAVYVTLDENGDRLRVVLQDRHREVLKRMQRVRHLGGASRAEVLRDPTAVFDGIADSVDIDPAIFGQRVRGIGNFPFVAQPYIGTRSGALDLPDDVTAARAGILCRYFDGREDSLPVANFEQAEKIHEQAREALRTGRDVIQVDDRSILVDTSFVSALEQLRIRLSAPAAVQSGSVSRPKRVRDAHNRYLLIYTNENELEYAEQEEIRQGSAPFRMPRSLRDGATLKKHQVAGAAWLHACYTAGRRGCLLADDMGLGKTLQVLTFLALLVENETEPKGSIIVVCPTVLLENRTWFRDAEAFFDQGGKIFQPWLLLHGSELKRMRRESGAEAVIGEPVLHVDRLKTYRLIFTNYETVTNYQHSFARLKDDVRVLILDEAQEAKTPNTKISHALKSMSPRFRIACTGTPVETRLLDAWNLFDFLQPGFLGTETDFVNRFERPLVDDPQTAAQVVQTLREQLKFGKRDAFVIRRNKEESLEGLPKKHEHVLPCTLSDQQRAWHVSLVADVKNAGGVHALTVLKDLIRLYQHPGLVPSLATMSSAEAIARCNKLAVTLQCLERIQERHEKCLIFTRTLDMQQVLASVIHDRFHIDVDIVNGGTGKRQTGSHRDTRAGLLTRFGQREGFNVIVLSPEVAGVGLTIVEANHVIHYGRWWNPAKEAQATDRVYRLGQTKDVHVHYPVATDPQGQFETFDQKLDALLRRRRALASEFLSPLPPEDDLRLELVDSLAGSEPAVEAAVKLSPDEIRNLSWSQFEALTAALEEVQGNCVCLTPLTGDDGIDVIASRGSELRLIQCKHTMWGARVDQEVVFEVVAGFDAYRARYLTSRQRQQPLVPVVVTNGEFSKTARREAGLRGVTLVSGAELQIAIMRTQLSAPAVERCSRQRLASMNAVKAWLVSHDLQTPAT
jgi:superfamily II DNA or RNA helicase